MSGAQHYCPFTGKALNEINQSFPSDPRTMQLCPSAEGNVGKHSLRLVIIDCSNTEAFESLHSRWDGDLKIREQSIAKKGLLWENLMSFLLWYFCSHFFSNFS